MSRRGRVAWVLMVTAMVSSPLVSLGEMIATFLMAGCFSFIQR